MVMASGRWLGVRMNFLVSILIGAVSLGAVLVSQDAGRCIYLRRVLSANVYKCLECSLILYKMFLNL